MTLQPDDLLSLADDLLTLSAQQRRVALRLPTREHWNATECLGDASNRVRSAALWLERAATTTMSHAGNDAQKDQQQ